MEYNTIRTKNFFNDLMKSVDENYLKSTVHHRIEQGRGKKASFTAAIISARSDEDGDHRRKKEESNLRAVIVKESVEYH